jgi:hypothetical protein
MVLGYNYTSQGAFTWLPLTGLYINSGATTAYTAGTVIATVYAKPTNTITYTSTATSIAGCTSLNTVTVTVNNASSAPASVAGINAICSEESTTFTANGGTEGTGCTYQWGTGSVGSNIISGANSASYETPALTSNTTYWVRRIDPAPCNTQTSGVTATVYIAPSFTWNGNTSNDWSNASNWKFTAYTDAPATAPASCSDVVIPGSGITNFPTISSPTSCNNITLNSGASLLGEGNLTYTSATAERDVDNSGTASTYQWDWHLLSSPVTVQDIWPEFAPEPSGDPLNFGSSGWLWDFYYYNPNCPSTGLYWVNLRLENGDYNSGDIDLANSDAGFGTSTPPEMKPGRGYLVAYQDDYLTANGNTRAFTGTFNTGNVSFIGKNSQDVFCLVGNPYPSAIDWNSSQLIRTVLENTSGYIHWIWNEDAGNYGATSTTGSVVDPPGTNGTSRYIAPLQGFFVKTAATSSTDRTIIGFSNDARVHNNQSWLKNDLAATNYLRLKLETSANSYSDEMVVSFDNSISGTGGADKLFSMYSYAPELYSVKNSKNFSIDMLKEVQDDLKVNVSAKCGVDANYTITATNIADFALCNKVYLEDLKTGNKINLKENNSYSFAGGPNDDRARFKLTFAETIGTDEPETIKPLYIYSVGKDVFINANQLTVGKSDIFIYDALGRLVYRGVYTPAAGNVKHTSLITPGAYVVKAITRTGTITAKIIIP